MVGQYYGNKVNDNTTIFCRYNDMILYPKWIYVDIFYLLLGMSCVFYHFSVLNVVGWAYLIYKFFIPSNTQFKNNLIKILNHSSLILSPHYKIHYKLQFTRFYYFFMNLLPEDVNMGWVLIMYQRWENDEAYYYNLS